MAGFQFASKREKEMEMGGESCWMEMEMSPCKRNRSITYRSHAIGTVGALMRSGKTSPMPERVWLCTIRDGRSSRANGL